jgi:hypothetical protein
MPHPNTAAHTKVTVSQGGRLVRLESEDGLSGEERYAINWAEFDGLMGRMLTIADASFTDQEQRKAVKDLIRQAIREWVANVAEMAWGDERANGNQSASTVVVNQTFSGQDAFPAPASPAS